MSKVTCAGIVCNLRRHEFLGHLVRKCDDVDAPRQRKGLNWGMRALGLAMGRRGFGYVLALTVALTFAGAAGT